MKINLRKRLDRRSNPEILKFTETSGTIDEKMRRTLITQI